MTSLLAFVWRKTDENCPPTDIDDHDFSPAVSASSSGETLTNQANEDSILDSPPTPEGFRPRKSVETIRRELNLPCNLSQRWLPACSALPPVLSCGSMPSPQASTSSFYSRSSKHQVAVSPNLGQAKTAVGALVAIAGVRAPVDKSSTDPKRESSILPPRTWLNDSRNIQDGNGYNAELPYESLNDSYTSPSKSHEHQFSGASDDESSIHASPSSTNWRSTLAAQKRQHNTSFTQGFLKMDPNVSTDHYDFYPLDGQDFVITDASAPALNMSGISHYTKDLESLHSLVDDADDDIEEDGCFEAMDAEDQSFCESLHRNKLMNQYRMKEDLLLSTLERLQDEPDLLFEVFGALKQQNGFQNGSFRMEKESFLTGYSREKREMICRSIDSIVNELRTSPQEEFFLSPSQLPEFTGTHDELEQALLFCRSLVRNAIPAAEKPVKLQFSTNSIPKQGHRWKCVPGFRASLGFDETPQSPETIRGGDTSLFSLPSESAADTTPHTSNVSLTTTITSAFSPEKRHLGYSLERVNIRRALNTVSNLFDSLSIACGKLAEVMAAKSDNSVEASAEIKCIHLQLMKLSVEDLKALIDSFELDLLPLQITRPVSQDHGEGADNNMNSSFLSQPQPLARSGYIHSTAQELVQQTMNIPIEPLGVNVVEQDEEDGINLFSPSTEDMNSIEQSTINTADHLNTADDLRRTVGSFDTNSSEQSTINTADHLNTADDLRRTVGSFDMNSIEQSTINTADHLNTADDLRRTVGSFDLEDVVEERDPPPRVRQRAERKAGMRGRGIWKRLGSRRFRRVAE